MSRSSAAPAWIAFAGAMLALVGTVGMQVWDRQQQRKHEVLLQREEALFEALHVIDNVYANTKFSGMPSMPGRQWDMQEARDAMSKMLIYSEDPNKTTIAFLRAIGRDPLAHKPMTYNAGMIEGFRREVARELHLPPIKWCDPGCTWLAALPGTKELMAVQKQKNKPAK